MIDFGFGVTLEGLHWEHSYKLFSARNDYSIWKWCRQNSVLSYIEHQAWFESQFKDKTMRMFSIYVDKEPVEGVTGREIVGVCGLTSIDPLNSRAEFSLYIFPSHQKNGYAKKALSTLVSHGFNDLNLNLIWGETFDKNPAYDMFVNLGFKYEGTRRDFYFRDGKYIDAHLVSLKRDEWTTPSR